MPLIAAAYLKMKWNLLSITLLLFISCNNKARLIKEQQLRLRDSIDVYEEISWTNNHEAQFMMREYEDTILTSQQQATVDSLMKVMSNADSIASLLTLTYDSLQSELEKIKNQ